MAVQMLLDSGAFSVWSKGESIDLNEYIEFCQKHPQVAYYVCLDVIPGTISNRRVTPAMKEEAARQGYKNYLKMCCQLPQEQVMPVWHRGEDLKWIEKYYEAGCRYIGFGGLVGGGQKDNDLTEAFRYVRQFDEEMKIHGFGVTSFHLMRKYLWHSVDSTTWIKRAAFGEVWVPRFASAGYSFYPYPLILSVSPKSPSVDKKSYHYFSLSANERILFDAYFTFLGVEVGDYEIVEVGFGHKKQKDELWIRKPSAVISVGGPSFFDKQETLPAVLKIGERGLLTCQRERSRANLLYLEKYNESSHIDHIYLAGVGDGFEDFQVGMKNFLMSFHQLRTSKKDYNFFLKCLEASDEN